MFLSIRNDLYPYTRDSTLFTSVPICFFFLFVCTSLFTIKSLSNQMCHVEDTRHLSLQEQGKQHGDFLILNTR